MAPLVTINKHTTASFPRPHILYVVEATVNGKKVVVDRRYSDFIVLKDVLKDPFTLPPKRILTTTFIPSAWLDDTLIVERKAGLTHYLSQLLSSPEYKDDPVLLGFLTHGNFLSQPSAEDALPSTLSRKAALKIAEELETFGAPIAAGYYESWTASTVPPESLDYSKWDVIYFAFATPSASWTVNFGGTETLLQRLVNAAHNSGRGTRVVLSIGGWGGCQYYSATCATADRRATFINSMKWAVDTYRLDGVDFDWEYPNSPGAGQPYSPADTVNFLKLIQGTRAALGNSKIVSAAVTHLPFLGPDGRPIADASAFAAQMNLITIMNYDVWGASDSPGPNAPLGDLCGTSKQPTANAQAALRQWTAAGFPASKLLLGLPLYGYVCQSTKTVLTGSLQPSDNMLLHGTLEEKGDQNGGYFHNGAHAGSARNVRGHADDVDPTKATDLSAWWGQQIPFNALLKSGALVKKADGTYGQGGGFTMGWDDCSETPYLFNPVQRTVVTYDDTWSLGSKAKFAKDNGMAGCVTWALDQDDGVNLQNAIRKNLGK